MKRLLIWVLAIAVILFVASILIASCHVIALTGTP
jgi:hypothetical protein